MYAIITTCYCTDSTDKIMFLAGTINVREKKKNRITRMSTELRFQQVSALIKIRLQGRNFNI